MSFPLLRERLDRAPSPVVFFFRDDDVGWADEAVLSLCDLFGRRAPLDLAVIPAAIDSTLASMLLRHPGRLGFHQHGYAHKNHRTSGKKCELGADRSPEVMTYELRSGQDRLRRLFGERLDPIFTPPWNRCGRSAAQALVAMDIVALSRDLGATPFAIHGLAELPVSVDWVKHSRRSDGERFTGREKLDRALAAAVAEPPVGVMLHHQVMDDDSVVLSQLLDLLATHDKVELRTMNELIGAAAK